MTTGFASGNRARIDVVRQTRHRIAAAWRWRMAGRWPVGLGRARSRAGRRDGRVPASGCDRRGGGDLDQLPDVRLWHAGAAGRGLADLAAARRIAADRAAALAVGSHSDRRRCPGRDHRPGRLGAGRGAARLDRAAAGRDAHAARPGRVPPAGVSPVLPLSGGAARRRPDRAAPGVHGPVRGRPARPLGRARPAGWPADPDSGRYLPRRRSLRRPALSPGIARGGPAARLAVPAQLVAAPPVHRPLDRPADRRQWPARRRRGAGRASWRPVFGDRHRSSDLWLRVHRSAARLSGRACRHVRIAPARRSRLVRNPLPCRARPTDRVGGSR